MFCYYTIWLKHVLIGSNVSFRLVSVLTETLKNRHTALVKLSLNLQLILQFFGNRVKQKTKELGKIGLL